MFLELRNGQVFFLQRSKDKKEDGLDYYIHTELAGNIEDLYS